MSGKDYLLDTNIVIGLFAREPIVVERIAQSGLIFIPSIVIGELFYGAEQSSQKQSNRIKIEEFAKACLVSECNFDTGRFYAVIKSQLKAKGKPIPENDIWIAALAQQNQLTLVTRDSHFMSIESLLTERW